MVEKIAVRRLFDLPVCSYSLEVLVEQVCLRVDENESCRIVALNTNKLYQMEREPLLRRSLENADVILPDGMSVVLASRILPGEPIPERVPGIDLFLSLLERCEKDSCRPYFFGARENVLEKMLSNFQERFPELEIAGYRDGYFDDEELPEILNEINNSGADMLFIGISSPLKEEIMERFGSDLEVPVVQGVGGSFDVAAGEVSRAPNWIQKAGLEWFHRFLKEPGRLWKRYLIANSFFLWRIWQEYRQS